MRRVAWTLVGYAWWVASEIAAAVAGLVPRRAPGGPLTLLLLTSAFPPVVTGGTYRPLALVRRAVDRGWRVLVASREPEGPPGALGLQQLSTVPPQARVARARPRTWPLSQAWFPSIDGGFLDALATALHAWWAFRRERPDVILASGPPFHVFVAGRYLARLFGRPLVLDYRDEWSQSPFDFVRLGNADAAWERRCLRAAAAVVFTTRSQLEHHRRMFPATPPNCCHVIPNGWNAGSTLAHPSSLAPAGPRLTLSFVGTLGDHTLPNHFLDTLRRAVEARPALRATLRVRFVGYRSKRGAAALDAFAIADMLERVSEVPKPEADRFMRESTALLLLNDPRFERYLPGKLYEYLAARRPVLVYGEGGESGRLVEDLDAGVIVPAGDASALAEAVERLGRWSGGGQSERLAAWLGEHARERLSQRMLDLLERVARSRPASQTR